MQIDQIIWFVVPGILLIAVVIFAVVFGQKKKHGTDSFAADLPLWIGIIGSVVAALLFLAITGMIPWPTGR